jgi:thiamine kinase-like enzyme
LKIHLLRKKENFLEIFQNSIINFFQEKFPRSSYIKIKYIINDRLNIVYPSKIKRNDLAELVSEFKYHPNFFQRFLQTIYVFVAIRWPLEIITSSESIIISVPNEVKKKWVFIPGNHSIRAIDLEKNSCFVFLKSGCSQNFIKSEMNIRFKNPWLKAPELIQKKNEWYEEQRVVGLPWNRLSSAELKKKIIISAQYQLSILYQKTTSRITIKEYVQNLHSSILFRLENFFSKLPSKEKNIINSFIDKTYFLISNSFGYKSITLVTTHGDFQPGNLLCSKDDFWLIDWEYTNQRSIFYDALVFDLDSRFPLGLADRLKKKIDDLNSLKDYLNWTGHVLETNERYYFSIFFLEDLLLKLDENSTKNIKNKSKVMSTYLTQLLKIQDILTKDNIN